jgi:hypothetical protein
MRHIQLVAERSSHRLNMIRLFRHHLRAQCLRLRRISLETPAIGEGQPLEHSFLSEFDHVTEPALLVGWRILDVPPARSVREGLGGGLRRGRGLSAGTWRWLLRLTRPIREGAEACQRQTDTGQEYGQTD